MILVISHSPRWKCILSSLSSQSNWIGKRKDHGSDAVVFFVAIYVLLLQGWRRLHTSTFWAAALKISPVISQTGVERPPQCTAVNPYIVWFLPSDTTNTNATFICKEEKQEAKQWTVTTTASLSKPPHHQHLANSNKYSKCSLSPRAVSIRSTLPLILEMSLLVAPDYQSLFVCQNS